MVRVKKNATNMSRWHLKTWRHVHRFFPPKALHFDGSVAVRHLVKHRNSMIVAPFAVKMRRVRRIVARLAKIAARLAKSAAIPYPAASRTNHKKCTAISYKKRHTNFTNCCKFYKFFLTCTVCTMYIYEFDFTLFIRAN